MLKNNFTKYQLNLLKDGVKLPEFQIEPRFKKKFHLKDGATDYDFLHALTLDGFFKLNLKKSDPKYNIYVERIKKELGIFKELGFCSYLLVTWDILNFCHENNIAVGYGRGSCCGSLVLNLIGVTKVDSIRHNLFFERFLSKTRAKFKEINGIRHYQGDLLMDIDIDISFRERLLVSNYLENKFKGKVCKVLTTSVLSTKILVKDVAKSFLEFNETEAKVLSDLIPKQFGVVKTIGESIEASEQFKDFCDKNKEFTKICLSLHELFLHAGCHASAWTVAAEPLSQLFPLELNAEGDIVTGYSMNDVLNIVPKVDLLGLRCATLIDTICKSVGIDANKIDLESPELYYPLQDLKTPHGLFQIEAETNYNVLRKIKPRNLNDLAAVVSLARPGALQLVPVYQRYTESGEFQSVHPLFDDVLKESAGIPIYQESLMRCANKIGFTLEEAEILRRICGKKKKDEVAVWQQKIKDKIAENNLDPKAGDILWSLLDASASYSFNFSHACAYASMCASTIYLKFKYPLQFFEALLNLAKDEPDPIGEIRIIQKELEYFNIAILPPDLIRSKQDFKIEGNGIRFGLSMVKSLSDKNMAKLIAFQKEYKNRLEIYESALQSKIPQNVLGALILSGCLDSCRPQNYTRSKMALESELYSLLTDRERVSVHSLASKFDNDLFIIVKEMGIIKNEKGKELIKESRMGTIKKHYEPMKEKFRRNSRFNELTDYMMECHYLGFSYSHTLKSIYSPHINNLLSLKELRTAPDRRDPYVCVVQIGEVERRTSKNKKDYVKYILKDDSDSLSVMDFQLDQRGGTVYKEDQICVFHLAKKKTESGDFLFFVNDIVEQEVPTVLKTSVVRKELEEKQNKE
jgi:DNA polymerase-3 subunit alpha